MKIKYLWPVMLVGALTACGGSGGGSSATSAGGVALFATDNLTQDYSEVWVTIYAVTTDDAGQQAVTLFNNTAGQVQNLRALAGVGALLDTQNLSAGSYDSLTVTLGNQINLVDANGVVTQALFDASAAADAQVTLDINASITITAGQNVSVALDFDLAQFTYDAATNQVTPVVVYKDPTQASSLVRTYAEKEGSVVSVADASHFVMRPESGGKDINVTLHPSAAVFSEATMAAADASTLAVGGQVEAYGNFNADTQTLEAVRLKIKDNDSSNDLQEINGTITTLNGAVMTVDVTDADFMPVSNSLELDASSATFTKGDITMLDTGMEVEVRGTWDSGGSVFLVTAVEIKGAQRSGDTSLSGEYAEIKGTVQVDPTSGDVSVSVTGFEHVTTVTNGDVLSLIATDAWYEEGDASCLVDGANVEVKGVVDAGALTASIIDVACGGGSDSHNPEANGSIASLDSATTLTLTAAEVGNFTLPANTTSVMVDFSGARFEHGLAGDLLVGANIDVSGSWNETDGIFTATELSFQ
jgi:hypothetical protein